MDIFSFSSTSHGIRVAATGIGHQIDPGYGSLIDITFDISEDADPGAYWMELRGVVVADPLGGEIEVETEGNWFTIGEWTSVESTETVILPQDFALEQNHPNPFNPVTHIRYTLPGGRNTKDGGGPLHTTLKVYNVLGQKVATLVDEYQSPGYYTVTWDGGDVPCGVYFYRLSVDGGVWTETKRMVLLK